MPYSKLLSNLIESANLSIKEVAIKCKEYGVIITASYISMIKNSNDKKIPSDDVSRALAKACGAENVESLVIEAYIDKAPKEFKGFLENYRQILLESTLMLFTNHLGDDDLKAITKSMNEMSLSELILKSDNLKQNLNFEKMTGSNNTNFEMTKDLAKAINDLREPEGFIIKDNSMYPIISKGSMVNQLVLPLEEYQNGDILLVVISGSKKAICRKCFFLDEPRTKVALMAYDQEIDTENYNIKDIAILGKAKRIITEL